MIRRTRWTAPETAGDILKANVLSQAIVSGVKVLAGAVRDMAGDFIESAANVQAEASQFTQTFGDMGDTASAAIGRVASSSGILDTRLNTLGSQIYVFARASGGDAAESMSLMETALQATADSAAYYDRSLEDTADSLQSFLKGNYENDAALGLSATETTRNAAAMDKFSKKFNDLTEIQKQQTLLQMVVDAQKLSGAMGQVSREADGWENVQGNLNESWRQFMAAAGTPALQAVIPVIQSVTGSLAGLTDALQSGGVSGLLAQLAEQFTGAVQSIGAAAPGLLQAGSTVMQSVADGIAAALPTLSATMQQVFTSLTGFIAAVLPALIPMGVDAVSALLSGITSALPLLVTAAQEIFSSLGGYLAANLPALVQKGMEALSGFASGLRTNVGLLVDICPRRLPCVPAIWIEKIGCTFSCRLSMRRQMSGRAMCSMRTHSSRSGSYITWCSSPGAMTMWKTPRTKSLRRRMLPQMILSVSTR